MPDALTPAQLDRIEDALERLELDGVDSVMADGESDAEVEATLSAYRSILELSREALPPVDVPAGLLDDVLREARAAAAAPASAKSESVPWYRRVRWNLWGPGLAFAGSAALLLLLVRPADEVSSEGAVAQGPTPPTEAEEDADAAAARFDRKSDDKLADASLLERNEDGEDARGAGLLGEGQAVDGFAGAADEDAEPAEEEITAEPASKVEAKPRARKGSSSTLSERDVDDLPSGGLGGAGSPGGSSVPSTMPAKKSKSGGAKAPPPAPKNEPVPTAPAPTQKPADTSKDASDAWSSVLAGDAKRRAGNCTGARASYNAAVDGDAKTRARALAGLGLCALAKGDVKTADAYFTKARKADGTVASFIEAERSALDTPDQTEPPNADVAYEQEAE